ncbi:serine protease 33-like isoform X3 [Varroa destructor]|nr:serine protease 33-like isoform X3 [Varroa destructor]
MTSLKLQHLSSLLLLVLLGVCSHHAATNSLMPTVPCGKPSYREARIIGGAPAKEGQFPWQVILGRYRRAVCGGAVISPNFVVTAAHCLQERDSAVYRLITGTIRKGDFGVSPSSQMRKVLRIMYHPGWRLDAPLSLSNDLALLKIDRPFFFDTHTSPVCLPIRERYCSNNSSNNSTSDQCSCIVSNRSANEIHNDNDIRNGKTNSNQVPNGPSTINRTLSILVSGFGATHEIGTPSDRLLYTEVSFY